MESKHINLSEAGKELDDHEDPLVCKLCGNNSFTVLDREEREIFCHYCKANRIWLDKANIPEQKYITGLNISIDGKESLKARYQKWKEGEELTEEDLLVFRECLHSSIYFNNREKKEEILEMLENMSVRVFDD